MEPVNNTLRAILGDLCRVEEWDELRAIEKRLQSLIEDIENTNTAAERDERTPQVCTTDCARYRAGTCPFDPRTARETCPRWREALHPLDD